LSTGLPQRWKPSRAEAALASVTAVIPELEPSNRAEGKRDQRPLGQNPHPIPRSKTLLDQSLPLEVPAGISSSLLERRPDIRETEQLLRAANAQVGVAVGDFLSKNPG